MNSTSLVTKQIKYSLTGLICVAGSAILAWCAQAHIENLFTIGASEAGHTHATEAIAVWVVAAHASIQARRTHTRTHPQITLGSRVTKITLAIEAIDHVIALAILTRSGGALVDLPLAPQARESHLALTAKGAITGRAGHTVAVVQTRVVGAVADVQRGLAQVAGDTGRTVAARRARRRLEASAAIGTVVGCTGGHILGAVGTCWEYIYWLHFFDMREHTNV